MNKNFYSLARIFVLGILGLGLTQTSNAQVIADPSAPGNQRPTILSAPNNVPLVNIQTPSSGGVSRNTYIQFNVQKQGVILNNSRNSVQTQLGGWVQGNPNLPGGGARVILNEVNSNNPSLLKGYIETAGQRAQVIIANPSGITCDGCGFINANRATLTTGTPIMNSGNLEGFRVQGGMMSIIGAGLDASTVDYTDIIARAVQVNAGIWAKQLNVVAGANQVGFDPRTNDPIVSSTIAGTGTAPAFAIDTALLGGMYAGKITLLATESGVGVRNAGKMYAGVGDVVITADGRLENAGQITSVGHTRIDSQSGVHNTGTIYAQGNTSIATRGDINNSSVIAAQGNVALSATGANSRITNSNGAVLAAGVLPDGTLSTAGNLTASASKAIDNQGNIFAANSINLRTTDRGTLTNRGTINGTATILESWVVNNLGTGKIYGDHIAIGATTLNNVAENGIAPVIAARNRLDIGAETINNKEHAIMFSSGDVAIGGSLDANKLATGQGTTLNNESATIEATGSADINVRTINNINKHFSTRTETLSQEQIVEYQGEGAAKRYKSGAPGVYTWLDQSTYLHTPEGDYENWYYFIYTRTTTETKVASTDPAKILSGSTMRLVADTVNNDKSQIIAGGTLAGTIGTLNNIEVPGEHITTDTGQVTYYWRESFKSNSWSGNKYRTRDSTTGYNPAPTVEAVDLKSAVYKQNSAVSGSGTQVATLPTDNVQGNGNSLYGLATDPTAHYLIETDPEFANYRNWLSSEYMLGALGRDPTLMQKRLGDGYYEQKLIREQVAELTGRRFLDGYSSDEEQYRALMNSGVTFAKTWNLVPGVSLSAAQMAQLTTDIVWLVEKEVTLPNGTRTKALVPQLYVRLRDGDTQPGGALMAGENVNLKISGDLLNGGTIAGRKVVALNAVNINNLGGRIFAKDVVAAADNDINNIGGTIAAQDNLIVAAERDLNVISTTRTQTNAQGSRTNIDRVAGLYVTGDSGKMQASAGRDVNLIAAAVQNQGSGDTNIVASNNINLGTVTQSSNNRLAWDNDNHRSDSNRADVGTSIQTQGNLNLVANKDINIKAAEVTSSKGDLLAKAGGSVSLTAGESNVKFDEAHKHTTKGFLSSETVTTRDSLDETTSLASTLSGKTATIIANQNINVKGSNVVSDDGTTLAAQQDINIEAATNTRTESHFREEKSSGLSTTYKSIGYSKSTAKDTYNVQESTAAASTIGAEKGDVVIDAGRKLGIKGSDVVAGQNMRLKGQEVDIASVAQTREAQETHERKSSGFGITMPGTLMDTYYNFRDISKRDGNFQKIDGALHEVGDSAATAPQLALEFTSSRSSSTFREREVSQRGSSLTSGGNMQIISTGTGAKDDLGNGTNGALGRAKDGDLRISGSQLSATGKVQLQAAKDVLLLTSTNTYESSYESSRKDSSFSTAIPTVGDTLRHINGGPNNGGVKAAPYNVDQSRDRGADRRMQQVGTTINARDIEVLSLGGDIGLQGAQLNAANDIVMQAKLGGISMIPGSASQWHSEEHSARTIGDLGSQGGTSNTVGVRNQRSKLESALDQQDLRSQLKAGHDINLSAKRDVLLRGVDLNAANDLDIIGANVYIEPGVGTSRSDGSSYQSQWGTTLSLGGWGVEAAQSAKKAINNYAGRDANGNKVQGGTDKRLSYIGAAKSALTVYNATQSGQQKGAPDPTLQPAPTNSGGAAIKVTVSVGGQTSRSDSHSQSTGHSGSDLQAGNNLRITARGDDREYEEGEGLRGDIVITGSKVKGKNVALNAARDIVLQSAVDSSSDLNTNKSGGGSVGVGFGVGGTQNGFTIELGATGARGKANGNSRININTDIEATDTLTMKSGRDTILRGAKAKGNRVEASIGRDLLIESLQDEETFESRQEDIGFGLSLCIPPICYGVSGPTASGNISYNQGNIKSHYLSVREQSGIMAGKGGYDINVKRDTSLIGGLISSEADAKQNRLQTATLTMRDIENVASFGASNTSLSVSYSNGSDANNLGTNLRNNAMGNAMPDSRGSARGLTKSAISPGSIIITDEDRQKEKTGQDAEQTIASINRDTDHANDGSLDRIFDLGKLQKERAYQKEVTELAQQIAPIIEKKIGDYAKDKTQAYTNAQMAISLAESQRAKGEISPEDYQNIIDNSKQIMADNQATYDLWKEGGLAKILLHGLAGGGLSALTGGNALKGAAAEAANEFKTKLVTDLLNSTGLSGSQKNLLQQLTSIGTGQAINGGQSAAFNAIADANNRQLHEEETKKLAELKKNKTPEEQKRLDEAACALAHCADGVPDSDPNYALLKAMQDRGGENKKELAELQQTGLFKYDDLWDGARDLITKKGEAWQRLNGGINLFAGSVGFAGGTALATGGAATCAPSYGVSCLLVPGGAALASLSYQQAEEGLKTMLSSYQSTEGQRVLNSLNLATYPGERDPLNEVGWGTTKLALTLVASKLIPKALSKSTGLEVAEVPRTNKAVNSEKVDADQLSNLRLNDKDPSTPVGRLGGKDKVVKGTNKPGIIGERYYTGHALDQMQQRGLLPSMVENAIQTGKKVPGTGAQSGTTMHIGNEVTVVTGEKGQVITAYPKKQK